MARTSTTITDSERGRELGARGGRPKKWTPGERSDSHVLDVLAGYERNETQLIAAGFPPTSPWWRETFERWYFADRPELVARVGRRGGKSSSLSRLGVAEALYGHHDIPPGDTGWCAIVSTDRLEAAGRLRTVCEILDALHVEYGPAERIPNAIELAARPIGFRVFTASIRGVSGFTSVFIFCDEVAKWKDADTGANPATVVLDSVRPTATTMPNARMVLSSSPVARWDAHYDAYERGETETQCIAFAPTWLANPTLTEADTHKRAPDPLAWRREFAAVPSDEMAESLLTADEIRSVERVGELVPEEGHEYAAAIDPATRGNAWTLVVTTLRERDGQPIRSVVLAREWRGTRDRPLSPRETLREIAGILAPYRVDVVWSDQVGGDAMRELADDAGLTLAIETWSGAEKVERYSDLVTWTRTRQVEIVADPVMRSDLLGIRRKYTRNGVVIDLLTTPDGRHSDYAPATAMALSRHVARPVHRDPELGTEAFERLIRERRRRAFQEQRAKPEWMPSGGGDDRGKGAWWKR